MDTPTLIAHCLSMPGAYLNCPFGPEPLCARIGTRIFAEIFLSKPWVTFKCEPTFGLMLREKYPSAVRRGYHCPPVQQPYNNTVTLDGSVPDDEVLAMANHSYTRALGSLTRAQRMSALSEESVTKP